MTPRTPALLFVAILSLALCSGAKKVFSVPAPADRGPEEYGGPIETVSELCKRGGSKCSARPAFGCTEPTDVFSTYCDAVIDYGLSYTPEVLALDFIPFKKCARGEEDEFICFTGCVDPSSEKVRAVVLYPPYQSFHLQLRDGGLVGFYYLCRRRPSFPQAGYRSRL